MGMVWAITRANDGQAAELRAKPSEILAFVNSEDAYDTGRCLDLDKHWHAVHFLLTGSAGPTDDPLSLIIGVFEEIGPDHGYGAAWFVPKDAITACSKAMTAFSDKELVARYDASAAVQEEVYLAETLRDEGDEAIEYLMDDVARFRVFVTEAARAGDSAFALIT